MDKKWMTGMARAPRGSTRLQIPMHSYKYSKWETIIRESVSAEINKNISARAPVKRFDRHERNEIRQRLLVRFSDSERLFMDALSLHISFYGRVANAEAGFDLGIRPQQVIVNEPSGYAMVFATIRSEACERLFEFEGVEPIYREFLRIRTDRLRSLGFSGKVDKSTSLMDLLVAALPYTTKSIGMSTPREIIDRAVEGRLRPFDA
jgi:hypothetical protein